MERYCKYDKPYIYTAFPAEQETQILPVLDAVAEDGALFWYADRFDRREMRRLQGAFGVLLFVNKAFANSDRFRAIVDAAVACGQKILCTYLEDIPSVPWSAMQLGSQQALFAEELDDGLISKLKESFIFRDMAVTGAQKAFQRNRAVTMTAVPVLTALILFFAVINPLLIAPARAINDMARQWGLTREDLENVTELYIVGDRVFDSCVHAWYEFGDRTQVAVDQDMGGYMENQGTFPVGTLTSDDLAIFAYMPNLERLSICGNQITDLSPLFGLKNLRELDLSANPIISLEGIDRLEHIESICLTNTDIVDASPLWDCPHLRLLLLDNTYISDITGAERLSNLDHLNISQTAVRDVSVLREAKTLTWLEADSTLVSNLRGIETLNRLDHLLLGNSAVREIPALGSLKNLDLDLRGLHIRDMSFIADVKSFGNVSIDSMDDSMRPEDVMPYLAGKPIRAIGWCGIYDLEEIYDLNITPGGHLGIANSYLTSLDGIEHFEGISELDIHYNANGSQNYLTDITAVLNLEHLETLFISSDMRQMAETQLQGARFEIQYCDD